MIQKASTPFSRLPPTRPIRGKRGEWVAELTLPTRLELTVCGLVERRIATYGFTVWSVGDNRLLMEHGAPIGEGQGATQAAADHCALIEGLEWLIREELHRRRVVAFTDSDLVHAQLMSGPVVDDDDLRPLVEQAREVFEAFPQITLRLITRKVHSRAARLAAGAYVAVQEAKRLQRTPPVHAELISAGADIYLVADRYRVDLAAGTCTCPDFRRMHTELYPVRCKHLLAAIQSAGART